MGEFVELLRLLGDHLPGHVVMTDTEGTIAYANESARRMFGHAPKLAAEGAPTMVRRLKGGSRTPEQSGRAPAREAVSGAAGRTVGERTGSLPSGSHRVPLSDGAGGIAGYLWVNNEACERTTVCEVDERYRLLLDNVGAGIGYFDTTGRLVLFKIWFTGAA